MSSEDLDPAAATALPSKSDPFADTAADRDSAALRQSVKSRLFGTEPEAHKVGRFSILAVLGEGGMGTVYAVYDDQLDRRVALKLVKGAQSDNARTRMLREAQAMAKLSHPNVVPVFEVGEHEGQLFIAMEFVKGVTLADWREESPRTWREVLTKYIQAGRGLAAAHAQGLVHRDFKPANAVVGEDGRVRVLDFGLAARHGEAGVDTRGTTLMPSPAHGALDTPLTQTGTVMGTPAYMPPEQFRGQDVDQLSDQFSFCVALWEAQYGARPFTGNTMAGLFSNITQGTIIEPAATEAPAQLRPLLERGLAARPADRWPDMETLLGELERLTADPAKKRTWEIATAVVVLGTAGVVGVQRWQQWDVARRTEACETEARARADGFWNDDARTRVTDGLLASGSAHAQTTVDKTLPWLDAYAEAWTDAHTEACLSANVRRTWSPDDQGRSQWCLDSRAMGVRSLVEQLEHADVQSVSKAVLAAAGLPRVEPCRDRDLLQRLPAPPDPESRDAVVDIRGSLFRAAALEATGKYDEAAQVARGALTKATALGRPSAEAAARVSLGSGLVRAGEYEEAEAVLEEAYFGSAAVDDRENAARACSALVYVVGSGLGRHDDARRWARHAEVALAGLGIAADDFRRSAYLQNLGVVNNAAGDYAKAKELGERALAIREAALGSEHPEVAMSLHNLANVYQSLGDFDHAATLYRRVLDIRQAALGPDHPQVAGSLNNIAVGHARKGEFDQARSLFERSLAIREKVLDPEHPAMAESFNNLALVHRDTGEYARAKPLYERALALREKALGPKHLKVASTLNNLGNLSRELGEYAAAKAQHQRALEIRQEGLGPDHAAVGESLGNLGSVYQATGEFAEAKKLYERSNAIVEKALGPDHPTLIVGIDNLGSATKALGQQAEAQALYERALKIGEEVLGPDHPDLARTISNLANIHTEHGHYDQAQALHERALAIKEKALGAEHPFVATTLANLADVHVATGDPGVAADLLGRAVAIYEVQDGHQPGEPETRLRLAKLLVDTHGDRSRALAEARKAADGFREAGDGKAESLREVEAWLRRVGEEPLHKP